MGSATIVGLGILAGCAGSAGPWQPVLDHPANPNAAQSPAPEASRTLEVDGATMPAATKPAGGAMVAGLYQCPMHPEVRSNNPNDRCPKCNMKINKPVKATPMPAGGGAHAGHEGH